MLLPFGRSWAFPNPPRLERIWGPGLIWEPQFLSGGTDLPLEWVWSLDINELICNCSCLKFRTKGGLGEHLTVLQCVLVSPEHYCSVMPAAHPCGFTAVRARASISAKSYFICSPPPPPGRLTQSGCVSLFLSFSAHLAEEAYFIHPTHP